MNSDLIRTPNGFEKLNPYLGTGTPVPSGWQKIVDLPILIFVGGMGVGKSTTLNILKELEYPFTLLPDRRVFTDRLMVAPLQREDTQPVRTLGRLQRLPYIQRYKQKYPAGIAHAISHLSVDPTQCEHLLVFDGLRGETEVRFAVEKMPKARFVALMASDIIRFKRLLNRRDHYDRIISDNSKDSFDDDFSESDIFAFLDIPDGRLYFSGEFSAFLHKLVKSKQFGLSELRDKVRILYEERRMYNLDETMMVLRAIAPQRTRFINTSRQSPAQVAQAVTNQIKGNLSSKSNHLYCSGE